jgi:energy-coupling factor transport system substrate-specific component
MLVNPIGWVQGLEGVTLAAAICALLFLEETGVPLPFAPGDLLLAIAGIAIAAGKVQPLPMVLATFFSIVAGAVVGREIFALIGWDRLMRIAGPLHARVPLEKAAQMLERNGWRAVFTARLIPGLRVHTTQVAGVSGMPRLSFLAGLVPATAVYVAAFVGLGVAFGRPILRVIHDAERQVLTLVVVLVIGLIAVLWLRRRAQRALASLGGWTGVFKLRLDSVGLALIPVCIGLNVTGHAIAVALKLPLFLDSIGTVLAAVLAGPWVGASVGLVTNLISSNTIDPIAAPYAVVSVAVGLAAGFGRYLNWQNRPADWLALWPVCFLIASVVSTPLNLTLNGGRSGVPLGDAVYAYVANVHFLPRFVAAYIGEAAVDLPDKLITVLAALFIYRSLPTLEPAERSGLELDVGEAFVFVFRSRRWLSKLLVGAICVLFSWLLIPLFLLTGYAVAVARRARQDEHELPPWDQLGKKVLEGFLITVIFLIWNLPGFLLSLPTDLSAGNSSGDGSQGTPLLSNGVFGALAALGGLWGLLVLMAQSAIWGQYLEEGFVGAFRVGAVVRRIRFHVGLTIVVGALTIVLAGLAAIGFIALGIGVLLTVPYASWVGAHVFGKYARLTDRGGNPGSPHGPTLLRRSGVVESLG